MWHCEFVHERRYVDDYFACLQSDCVAHDAVSEKKLGFGSPLCILGLVIEATAEGMTCFPSPEKIKKWLMVISEALETGRLTTGAASKLAGGLSWGAQNMFHRYIARLNA